MKPIEAELLDLATSWRNRVVRELEGLHRRTLRECATDLESVIAKRFTAQETVWHGHTAGTSAALCGADYPNMARTEVEANVTCLACREARGTRWLAWVADVNIAIEIAQLVRTHKLAKRVRGAAFDYVDPQGRVVVWEHGRTRTWRAFTQPGVHHCATQLDALRAYARGVKADRSSTVNVDVALDGGVIEVDRTDSDSPVVRAARTVIEITPAGVTIDGQPLTEPFTEIDQIDQFAPADVERAHWINQHTVADDGDRSRVTCVQCGALLSTATEPVSAIDLHYEWHCRMPVE